MSLFNSNNKIGNLLLGFLYAITYDYIYITFAFKVYGYMGVQYEEQPFYYFIIYILLSSFPLLFYKGFVTISSIFSLFYYLFAYVPIFHSILYSNNIIWIDRFTYSLIMFSFMCLFFKTDKLFLGRSFMRKKSKKYPVRILFKITIILTIIMVITNYKNIHFVNFVSDSKLLYDYRFAETSNRGGVLTYIILWLANSFLPVLLIYYLQVKNLKKSYLIFIFYILNFMVTYQKFIFCYPFLILSLFYLSKKQSKSIKLYSHSFLILSIAIVSSIITYLAQYDELFLSIASIIIYRTVCVSGHLFSMYYHFFQTHPLTYYSHINIINYITNYYPYDDVLGRVAAEGAMNANAAFIMTDGIAAMGLIGVVIISILFIFFKSFFNSILLKYKLFPTVIVFIPGILSFLNVSLFTTLITGGMIVTYFILKYFNLSKLNN